MPAKIRLKRVGRKKQSSFRIVVTEKSESVTGAPIEQLGIYHPRTEPSVIRLDAERALHWLRTGARPSDTVRSLFQRAGLWEKFHDGVTPEDLTEKEIFLGPEGAWTTSRRAEAAEEARKAAEEAEEAAAEAEEAAAEAGEEPAATATEAPPEEAEEAEEPDEAGEEPVEAEAPEAEAAEAEEAEAEEEEEAEAEEPTAEAAGEEAEEEEDEDEEDEEAKEG